MRSTGAHVPDLLKKLGGLLLVYALCRLLFYSFHHTYFSDLSFGELALILLAGIRFDLSVIMLSNSLFILLYLLPFPVRERPFYRTLLRWLFLLVNSIAMLANCVDLAYFSFTFKRTTADVFNFFGGDIGHDAGNMIPAFLRDYWYVVIIWLLLCICLWLIYKRSERHTALSWTRRTYLYQVLILVLFAGLSLIAYRGGLQMKPISTLDAGQYARSKNIPLVVSTPFTILKTLDLQVIEPVIFFADEKELKMLYNPYHQPSGREFRKMNVFLIALESFGKEYVGAINGRKTGYTPFLDSLIGESLTFSNAFSNGKKSIEGIPAITASLPSWMNEPYITSPYGGNRISSLAGLLRSQGYYTAFFHGGTNGTMGFDAFASLAGYHDYYGRTEYNNEKDFDGSWGIWDEEFFQYTAKTMSSKPEPFFSTLFTLSSHHPYEIPSKYRKTFPEGPIQIHKSIRYSDHALKRFFETAKTMPWYNNTLFVLVADHTSLTDDRFYINKVGNNSIPLLFYKPGSELKGIDSLITQQIDIMPSVLDYLGYPQPYFSFGNSVFDPKGDHFAFTMNTSYQLIEDGYTLTFNGTEATELYDLRDSLLSNNLISIQKDVKEKLERKAKAILQTYQQSLIRNTMH